jgi:CoA:oxalate CoA-transferase
VSLLVSLQSSGAPDGDQQHALRPLDGIRVLDFTHVMAGPFATNYLSQLGARVTKIEPLTGDLFRYYGDDQVLKEAGMAAAFVGANTGKESIALDMSRPEAREIVAQLVAESDVIVENFRPGSIARMGFDYDACVAIRPDIIYCSISGFGQFGPMRDYPAIDNVIQAISGMMSVSGERDSELPIRLGIPAVDTFAATTAAMSIITALLARERIGGGQHIDVSMLDAALVLLYGTATPYLVSGTLAAKTGNTGYSGSQAAGVFKCADGRYVSLGAVQDNQFLRFQAYVDHPELTLERFGSMNLRLANSDALQELLRRIMATRPAAEWEPALSGLGVPCGLVRNVGEALELDQLNGRGLLEPARLDALGKPGAHVLTSGFRFDHGGPRVSGSAPTLGQHTRTTLLELGFSEAEVDELERAGVVGVVEGVR